MEEVLAMEGVDDMEGIIDESSPENNFNKL